MLIESSIVNALKMVGMPQTITPVLSDRNGVEPAAPYLLINVISTTNIGLPTKSIGHTEFDKTERVFQVKDYLISLTFHAEPKDITHDWVQHFHTGIFSDMVDYAFTQQGLGLVDTKDIMYQPQPVDGKNYKRAIIDLTVRTEVQDSYTVNSLEKLRIQGEFDGNATQIVVEAESPYHFVPFANSIDELVNEDLPST